MTTKYVVKFNRNEKLNRLIQHGCLLYQKSEPEYLKDLIQQGLLVIEDRLEHESYLGVFSHFQNAVDFFEMSDVESVSVELDRQEALELKLFCREHRREMLDVTTMLLCYSILRD